MTTKSEPVNNLRSEDRETRNDAYNFLVRVKDTAVAEKLTDLIPEEPRTRNLAGELLLSYKEAAVPALLSYIKVTDDDDDLKFAIDILGLIGNSIAEDELIKIIKRKTNENLVLSCVEALGNIKSKKSAEFLIGLFGQNEVFDPIITDALGKIGTPEVKQFFMKKYNDADEMIKYAILESFGETGDEGTFFFLLNTLNNAPASLTGVLLSSLYKLKCKYGFDIPFDERIKNQIISAASSGDEEQKYSALMMLAEYSDRDSIQVIINNYGFNPELDLIIQQCVIQEPITVLEILVKTDSLQNEKLSEMLNIISGVLKDSPEQFLQVNTLRQKEITSSLTELLTNPAEEIRYSVLEILYNTAPECLFICSDLLMKDDNMWNRARYVDLLENFEPARTAEILKFMANDSEQMIREKATELLKNQQTVL